MLEKYYIRPTTIDRIHESWTASEVEQYISWTAERRRCALKLRALRTCEVGSGISAASRARIAWKDDKTLLGWLNSL